VFSAPLNVVKALFMCFGDVRETIDELEGFSEPLVGFSEPLVGFSEPLGDFGEPLGCLMFQVDMQSGEQLKLARDYFQPFVYGHSISRS
jgi:hypothetical protein